MSMERFFILAVYLGALLALVVLTGCTCGDDDDDSGGDDDDLDDDDDDAAAQCVDEDGDTYGSNCEPGPDCNDFDPNTYQWLTGYEDADQDGYPGTDVEVCAGEMLPAGYFDYSDDCDDEDPLIHPGATEFPDDGIDQDCDDQDFEASDTNGVFVDGASGDDVTGAGTMASPYATVTKGIQEAENAKAGGTNVYVAAGTYTEDVETSVSMFGGYAPGTWARDIAANVTTLVPTPVNYSALTTAVAATLTVEGFTLQGQSSAAESIGLFVGGSGVVTAANNRFLAGINCNANWGIKADSESRLLVANSEIDAGSSAAGTVYGIQFGPGRLSIYNTTIECGDASIIYGLLGQTAAVDLYDVDVSIGVGSATYGLLVTPGTLTANRTTVHMSEIATGAAFGAIVSTGYGRFNQCHISVEGLSAAGAAYGVQVSQGTLTMNQSFVTVGVVATGATYGVVATGATNGDQFNVFNSLVVVGDSDTAYGVYGTDVNSRVVNNTVVVGGGDTVYGVAQLFGAFAFGESNFVNNTISVGTGATDQAVFTIQGTAVPSVALINNNLDIAAKATGCLIFDGIDCFETVADVNDCSWPGCYAAVDNISVPPAFANPSSDDYSLNTNSALIDAGVNPLPYVYPEFGDWIWNDLDGNARPAGETWDLGAFEYGF